MLIWNSWQKTIKLKLFSNLFWKYLTDSISDLLQRSLVSRNLIMFWNIGQCDNIWV